MFMSSNATIYSYLTNALMNSSFKYYFVFHQFTKHKNIPLEFLDYDLSVALSLRAPLICSCVYQNCEIMMGDQFLTIDLVPLVIQHVNDILSIDWLSANQVFIDCEKK